MSNETTNKTLQAATARILRPLIKILLRYGVGYAAFSEQAKGLFYDVAKTEFAIPGKKQTASRISTMTGLSRKECTRLESLDKAPELDTSGINRAARVISGWTRDPDFIDEQKEPRPLPFEGEHSFSELVKRYSGDITARTIADELSRVGAIAQLPGGNIQLNQRAYISKQSDLDKLTILGTDVAALITTIDHNISSPDQAFLQRKVSYNYIPVEDLPELNKQLSKIAQSSLEKMDRVLASHSHAKQKARHQYARTGVGIYYFEEKQ